MAERKTSLPDTIEHICHPDMSELSTPEKKARYVKVIELAEVSFERLTAAAEAAKLATSCAPAPGWQALRPRSTHWLSISRKPGPAFRDAPSALASLDEIAVQVKDMKQFVLETMTTCPAA